MAFNFGGTPAGGAPAPGAPAPAFGFGAAPAPANNNAAPAAFGATPAAAPAGGFSFGGAPAPATNTATPVGFGATPAAGGAPTAVAPATGGFGAPAAPAAGGFPVAGTAPATTPAAPTTGAAPSAGFSLTPAAPTPGTPAQTSGGFGFGGTPAAPAAPAGGLFGNNTPASSTAGTTATATSSVLKVPDFNEAFPFFQLPSKIRVLEGKVSTGDQYAAQQLLELMQEKEVLSKPPAPTFSAANASVRQQLQQNPHVELDQRQAALTQDMLKEVFTIADELHLSEERAMSLYKEASKSDMREFLKGSTGTVLNSVTMAASELFFMQRSALLKSILLLCQCRLERKLLEATDVLLQKNLIGSLVTLIQDLTKWTSQLDQPSTQPMPEPNKRWLSHLYHERQVAAECLFYLTYSTQCNTSEVAALIDLIHSLTNEGLGSLDPIKDVPDAFHPQPQTLGFGFTQALPPLREKDVRDWEKELVESVWKKREPHTLQCVSVLILAVLCALDTKQELLNRETHDVNQFGVGNTLFRSLDATGSSGSLNDVSSIHERLHGDAAVTKWSRKDIWGVLAAAYALSLRPVSAVVASPRSQQASMVKRAWQACLKAPTDHKSFTFVRLSLMPAISNTSKPSDPCDLHEFLLSVLSEFLSTFLDVVCASNAIPPSRSRWYDNATEVLNMRREEQERTQSFYQSYGNTAPQTQEEIPIEVDLMKRPDCIDDIFGIAVAVCSEGPDYSSHFWAREEYRAENGSLQVRPISSRALKKLELLQGNDKSLIPTYVSFLGALAISEPSAVFDLLSTTTEGSKAMDWKTLFSTLRWYVRKMSDGYAREVKPSTTTSETAGTSSSAYYYGIDDPGDSTGGSSTMSSGGSSQSAANTGLKELGEINTAIVLSHLAVITKVAANYASGRTLLATMKLSLEDSEEGDSVLVVLFSLAIAPLTPHVRGAVLATIAALLKLEGTNEKEEPLIRDLARKGWDLLELSQAVPVFALDQYQGKDSAAVAQAMAFPPSSISAANSGAANSWLPVDPKFGIIFEMEHVESRLGYYPSTEGLLQLITSLVVAAGCPMDLGQTAQEGKPGRLRPGCTPYIEYVVSFVIPRTLGSSKKNDRLPFKSGVESSRLASRALEVVEAVLTRFAVPSGKKNPTFADELNYQKQLLSNTASLLRLPEVTEKLMLPPTEADMLAFLADFDPKKNIVPLSENAKAAVSLPRTKSPGYLILADMLSSSDSDLLRGLSLILTHDGGREGMHSAYGQQDFRYKVTWALFGDTVPSVATAKHKQESVRSLPLQSLLKAVLPTMDVASDLRSSTDSIYWRTRSIGSALRILAAASVREQQFLTALSGVTTIVPALQFKAKVNLVQKKNINLTSVRDALKIYTSHGCLPAVVQCLPCMSSNDVEDSAISGTALALLVYCFANSSASSSLSAIDARSIPGELRFARAVAERLAISSKRTEHKEDADIVRVILTLIQSEMSHVLLGFPHTSADGLDAPGVVSQPFVSNPNECLSVLLDRLRDDEFLTNPSSSGVASTCFEIMCNLTSLAASSHVGPAVLKHLAARLTAADFWNGGIMRFLAVRNAEDTSLLASTIAQGSGSKGVENVLHGAAYFFNGLATHCAMKVQLTSQDSLSKQNQRLLSSLLDKEYHLLCNAVQCLPLHNEDRALSALGFPKSLLPLGNAVQACMYQMEGKHEYVAGYWLIDVAGLKKKLATPERTFGSDEEECVKWAENWNEHVQWNSAAAHLSGATSNLTEASLEYSDWSLQSGISNLLHQSNELSLARDSSLLILLDQMVDRLVGDSERVTSMSNRLLKAASINISTEVLLLVERLLASTRHRLHLPHFVERIGLATTSSLIHQGSNELPGVDDDERSVVLGAAMAQILDSGNVEISEKAQDIVCHAAASFSELCCHSVNDQTSDEAARRAKISMASRSILSSLISSLDAGNPGDINPIVATLATTTALSSTSKTALQALVQVISTLDDNVCLLLEKIACSSEGSTYLVNAGVTRALVLAASNYSKTQRSSMNNPPSFFRSNLSLIRALLASESLTVGKRNELLPKIQELLVSYSAVIVRAAEAFPRNGETWLDIVQTLALALNDKRHKTTFGKGMREASRLQGLDRLVGNVVTLTANLVEFPFPARYLPLLAPKLHAETPEHVWWETVEQQLSTTAAAAGDITLPAPPTGLAFMGSTGTHHGGKDTHWSSQKYEACYAAAQVVDASLTFLIEISEDDNSSMEFPVQKLARGICRLTDSCRAMSQRLKDIEAFSKGSAMDVGAFDSHTQEAMLLEQNSLQEIAPLFGRCCEKLLIVGHKQFQKMQMANEESFRGLQSISTPGMKSFAENVLVAIRHTGLDTMGVQRSIEGLEESDFAKTLAKKMQQDLAKVVK